MESISDLALKGHFEQLKNEANNKRLTDQPLEMLMKALAYLEKINRSGILDDEGKSLMNQLKGYSSELALLSPKPMARAQGNVQSESQTKKKEG